MTAPGNDIAAAEAEAATARRRFLATADTLKARLRPAALAHDAGEKLKAAGTGAARSTGNAIKQHPLPAIGVVAAITAFIARKPLWRLIRRKKQSPEQGKRNGRR